VYNDLSHKDKNLITPECLLKHRFGKSFEKIVKKIPHHSIISFFDNSIDFIEKDFTVLDKINWFGHQSKLIIFSYLDLQISLVTLPMGPSLASMVLEELIYCGVVKVISIGFAGSINPLIKPHDIVIPTESFKDEGVANLYLPENSFVSSSNIAIEAIEKVLHRTKTLYHKGSAWSISTPYRESYGKITRFQKENVVCTDMESASLFAIAEYYKINFASIFSISDCIENGIWIPHFKDKKTRIMKKHLLQIALESLILI